ncbi:hypothetical protein WJX72_005016 [[Myrmecia] bisecta]|uniref:Uncharacterized protein n=1 Tax=[Myrmecia] bisecta TaxID=41462 RepID=A0AAW1PED4_9CHLO
MKQEVLQQLGINASKSVSDKDTIRILLARLPGPNCHQPYHAAMEVCRLHALSISAAEACRRFAGLTRDDLDTLAPVLDPVPYHCGSGRSLYKLLDVLRLGHRKAAEAEQCAGPAPTAAPRAKRPQAVAATAASSQAVQHTVSEGELDELRARVEARDCGEAD